MAHELEVSRKNEVVIHNDYATVVIMNTAVQVVKVHRPKTSDEQARDIVFGSLNQLNLFLQEATKVYERARVEVQGTNQPGEDLL